MTISLALFMIIFASFMWGSWVQFVKFIKGWSINGFMVTLYSFSLLFTWIVLGSVKGLTAYGELFGYLSLHPQYLLYPLLGGVLYTTGMWFNLNSVKLAGLSLTFIIFSSIGIIFGTLLSILAGGLPEGVSVLPVFLGCLLMLGAVLLSSQAAKLRDKEKEKLGKDNSSVEHIQIKKVLNFAIISGLLVCSYPFFMTLSMKTSINAEGLDAYQYIALLSVGSMIAISFLCIRPLVKSGEINQFFKIPWTYHGLAVLSGLAHYGGNILNAVAAPVVGLAISWPLGQTMAIWGTLWGLVHGEFKGSSKGVYLLILSALGLLIIGTLVLSASIYS